MDPKKIHWRRIFSLRSILYILLGNFLAVVGMKGFMMPNHFLDGGVTGISLLVNSLSDIPISILLLLLNLPFLFIGFHKLGRTFGMQTLLAILLLALAMHFIEVPVFTNDKVLIALFGGFFVGLGIGFVIRGGGVIDGMDVIGQYTERRSAFTASEIILSLNILMILVTAIEFGVETGMYTILTYYTAMKTTDYVVDGFEEYTALTVISGKAEEIREVLVNRFGKAVTIYKGERGFLPGVRQNPTDCDIIVCVVTRLEIHRMKMLVNNIDPKAFLYVSSIREVKGGIVSRQQD